MSEPRRGKSAAVRQPRKQRPPPEHLVCTAPKASVCGSCGVKVLRALAYGERVRLDVAHINRKGEVVALISGIGTYQWGDTKDEHVRRRNAGMISRQWPAVAWVHADHRCGFVWDQEYLDTRIPSGGLPYSQSEPPF
jgi:hypothetical protein